MRSPRTAPSADRPAATAATRVSTSAQLSVAPLLLRNAALPPSRRAASRTRSERLLTAPSNPDPVTAGTYPGGLGPLCSAGAEVGPVEGRIGGGLGLGTGFGDSGFAVGDGALVAV